MTAPDGLLRDAGGARPTSDVDALIERLQGFNPPDRTIASQRDYSQAIHDAAAALVQLRDENTRLDSIWDSTIAATWLRRAERAEAEVARLRAAIDAAKAMHVTVGSETDNGKVAFDAAIAKLEQK
jgi:hypothetical protein